MLKPIISIFILIIVAGCTTAPLSIRERYVSSVPSRPQAIKDAIRKGKVELGMTMEEVELVKGFCPKGDRMHMVTEYGVYDTWYYYQGREAYFFKNGKLNSWNE